MTTTVLPVRARLDAALREALRRQDRVGMSALRSVLAAIDNASASEADSATKRAGAIEHATPFGRGSDVARRVLAHDDILRIARAEITERHQAADEYINLGATDRSTVLRAEAAIIERHIA